jgi:tRNA 2-thiouridine synthesizing protein A
MATRADTTLDCIGLYCPMPIVKTAAAIARMAPGQVLEVLADDKGIATDMPAWCESTGNECLSVEKKGDEYRVYVRKKGS